MAASRSSDVNGRYGCCTTGENYGGQMYLASRVSFGCLHSSFADAAVAERRYVGQARMTSRRARERVTRDLHFLNKDGMVACNPRDREAAHRAEVEGIATEYVASVTCRKCRALLWSTGRQAEPVAQDAGPDCFPRRDPRS